jgi:hypothetical protein
MSAVTAARPSAPDRPARARRATAEGLAAAQRVLTKLRHDPGSIALTLGAPVFLVLIFGYVFGSAIAVPGGGNYRAFLVSGLFATIAGNILPSMVAMARDATRGVVDRFRSLPVSRAAVPFGQAAATSVYGLISFILMAGCGLVVGWRIDRGPADAAAALLQRAGRRRPPAARQPGRPGQRGVAAGAPGRRVARVDGRAAGRVRAAVHPALRPLALLTPENQPPCCALSWPRPGR